MDTIKLYEKASKCNYSSYEIFKEFVNRYDIVKPVKKMNWLIDSNNRKLDHINVWKDADGNKVITTHPYSYDPRDPGAEGEELGRMAEFQQLAKKHNLNVTFYESKHSWYYPNDTMLLVMYEGEQLF